METPLLFMIFNRPDITRRTFAEIRKLRPAKLFISADGPRPNRPDDIDNCRETREAVAKIDWPCQVERLYHDKNLGCGIAPGMAVTWFFQNVEAGIILEDDCICDTSFFTFAAELLEKYKNDPHVMQISGTNFQRSNDQLDRGKSYYFSILPHLWGWASWRRAWKNYDVEMRDWPQDRDGETLRANLPDPAVYEYWTDKLETYYSGTRNSWEWPWLYFCMREKGLSAIPTTNLVTNIGYGPEATHTKNLQSPSSNMSANKMAFPLVHPDRVEPDIEADSFMFKNEFGIDATLRQKIVGPLRRIFPKTYRNIKDLKDKKARK